MQTVIKLNFFTSPTDVVASNNTEDPVLATQDILPSTGHSTLSTYYTIPTTEDTLPSLNTDLHDSSTDSEILD